MQSAEEMGESAGVASGAGAAKPFSGRVNYASARQALRGSGPPGMTGAIEVRLHELIAARGLTLAELSNRVGVTVVNLSVLKNGHARAIRFSTLARLCEALDCQPGDLLSWSQDVGAVNGPLNGSASETEAAGRGTEAR